MSAISTHILDTTSGRPASNVTVVLEYDGSEGWSPIAREQTDADGRVMNLISDSVELQTGSYRLIFDTGAYFWQQGIKEFFYPLVTVSFAISDASQHYHVPLLLSPYGYSTYRGN